MSESFDFSVCEQEALAFTGTIQGVGVLCRVDEKGLVTHVSDNTMMLHQMETKHWLGKDITLLVSPNERQFIKKVLHKSSLEEHVLSKARRVGDVDFDLLCHRQDQAFLLEWVPGVALSAMPDVLFSPIESLESACEKILQAIQRVQDFDRVIIYRFEDDGSGTVVAERNNACSASVLGLRYPKTDIPQVARDLMLKHGTRTIYDINAKPVPILALESQTQPLDLGPCKLRSVSQYHLDYLTNLDIATSCSVPITPGGKLWGLITVQYIKPQVIGYSLTRFMNRLARGFGIYWSQRSISAFLQLQNSLGELIKKEFRAINKEQHAMPTALADILTQYTDCDGAALYNGVSWSHFGLVPDNKVLTALVSYFANQNLKKGWSSDYLSEELRAIVGADSEIKGLAAAVYVPSAKQEALCCLLFKKGADRTVTWGSRHFDLIDEDKPSPVASFGRWQELLQNHSLSWPERTKLVLQLMRKTFSLEVSELISED